jgi:hypothetical protein
VAETRQQYKISDAPNVPETYANQFISGGFDGSSIAINLGTARLIPDRMGDRPKEGGIPTVVVTTRLMMSVAAAVEMIKQLTGMMETMGIKVPTVSGAGAAAPTSAPAVGGDSWPSGGRKN